MSGVGGFYASDALSSTYSYGGALAFYPSEDFGLELLYGQEQQQLDLQQGPTFEDNGDVTVLGKVKRRF